MKKDWEIKKLGEICKISTGQSNANQATVDGKYVFFDRSKTIKRSARFLFDCEALIIPGEGAEFFPRYYSGKFDLHQRAYALFNFTTVDIRFAEYYLIFDHKYFERVAVGATAKSLRLRHFQDLKIPFPSLPEQKRIIKILDQVFSQIEYVQKNTEKNFQKTQKIFECYLERFLQKAKNEWGEKKLGDVCTRVEYGSAAKSKKLGEVPVLRMGNIQNGKFDWSNLVFSDDINEINKYLLKYNDVLFNRTNSPELVGKTAIYKSERPAIFAGYLIRLHRKETMLDANFLNYFLNSKRAKNYGKIVMISSVNQANINGTKLKTYPIPLPPLSEQKHIAKKLDLLSERVNMLKLNYQKKISELNELKKSILNKAFNGEL